MLGAQKPLHFRQGDERGQKLLRDLLGECAISWVSKRSRFFEKVEASNTFSSMESPTNQRNKGQTRSARPAGAPSGSYREAAEASPAANAPAQSTAVRFDRKAPKTLRRVRPGPRSSGAASPAADASLVSAPPCQRTRTTPRSSDPRPASTPRDSPTHRPRESRDNNKHQKIRASLLQQPASIHFR